MSASNELKFRISETLDDRDEELFKIIQNNDAIDQAIDALINCRNRWQGPYGVRDDAPTIVMINEAIQGLFKYRAAR